MAHQVVITTPFPSLDAVSKELRVSNRRVSQLMKIAQDVLERRNGALEVPAATRSSAPSRALAGKGKSIASLKKNTRRVKKRSTLGSQF